MILDLHQIQNIHDTITVNIRLAIGFPNSIRNNHEIKDVNLTIRIEVELAFIGHLKPGNLRKVNTTDIMCLANHINFFIE